jgi:hypothetical protein
MQKVCSNKLPLPSSPQAAERQALKLTLKLPNEISAAALI